MVSNSDANYNLITESPNLKATQEQLARLYQRYRFAIPFTKDKDVLEVACGSGIGLRYLAKVAKSVVGVDIDEKNVVLARKCYDLKDERNKKLGSWENGGQNNDNRRRSLEISNKISVDLMDAHTLDFSSGSFDLVLLYEAVYYLQDSQKFVSEAERVLREDGALIICTVNKDWEDFHPSPYTHKYFSVPELSKMLKEKFNRVEMYGGFPITYEGLRNKIISFIKRMAVNYNLIPGSLKARAYLKRLFMGRLTPLPAEVYEDMTPYEEPVSIPIDKVSKEFKIIYAVAFK